MWEAGSVDAALEIVNAQTNHLLFNRYPDAGSAFARRSCEYRCPAFPGGRHYRRIGAADIQRSRSPSQGRVFLEAI